MVKGGGGGVRFKDTGAGLQCCVAGCDKVYHVDTGYKTLWKHAKDCHGQPLAKRAPKLHRVCNRQFYRTAVARRLGISAAVVGRCAATLDDGTGVCENKRVGTGNHKRCHHHRPLGVADARDMGVCGAVSPIVSPHVFGGALGTGVIANRRLRVGDVVTEYSPAPMCERGRARDHYTLELRGARLNPLVGTPRAIDGLGLGSLVNCYSGVAPAPNVKYTVINRDVFIKVVCEIPAGEQLLASYGRHFVL